MNVKHVMRHWIGCVAGSSLLVLLVVVVVFTACSRSSDDTEGESSPPLAFTADIQAGIESYIDEQIRLGGGYFNLPYKDAALRLKLVKVHTEYLANLGPGIYLPVLIWRT